jgi:hypothetical protein
VQGVNNYNGFKFASTLTSLNDFDFGFSNGTTGNNTNATGYVYVAQCDPAKETIGQCAFQSLVMSGYIDPPAWDGTKPFDADMTAFVKGLCTPLGSITKGVPKTARSATVSIVAKGIVYKATYFTAPKKVSCE